MKTFQFLSICLAFWLFSFTQATALHPGNVIRWTGGEGSWLDTCAWDVGRLPAPTDHVFIGAGQVTIPAGPAIHVQSINLLGDAFLTVSRGAQVELIGNNSLYSSVNLIEQARLDNAGDIRILESVSSGVTVQGGLFFNTGLVLVANSPIEGIMTRGDGQFVNHNRGTVEVRGNSQFAVHLQQHGVWRNYGALYIQSGIRLDGLFLEGRSHFINRGLLHFQAPTGDNSIDNRATLDNTGQIIVDGCTGTAIRNDRQLVNDGILRIYRAGGHGIACVSDSSAFRNAGTIEVQLSGDHGIRLTKGARFQNVPGSQLHLRNCKQKGLFDPNGQFENRSQIRISRTPYLDSPPVAYTSQIGSDQ